MGVRAFSDPKYDYYAVTKNLAWEPSTHGNIAHYLLPKGAVFYHDKEDKVRGSEANGCLKNCWTPEGGCYGYLAADTIVFHADFIHTDMFELVKKAKVDEQADKLKQLIDDLERELHNAKVELKKICE